MGIQDRDYYKEHYRQKRYNQSVMHNLESSLDYSLKRSLIYLFKKSLIYIFFFLIFLIVVKHYKAQIRAVIAEPSHTVSGISLALPKTEPKPDQHNLPDLSSCISNDTNCVCYNKLSERLSIPLEVCRQAIDRGF